MLLLPKHLLDTTILKKSHIMFNVSKLYVQKLVLDVFFRTFFQCI